MGVCILKPKPGQAAEWSDGLLVEALGLTPDQVQTILADFRTEYEAMSAFFR
jgi:hypothetical protein